MKLLRAVVLACSFFLFIHERPALSDTTSELAGFYVSKLHGWLDAGGAVNTIEAEVLTPCSKLVLVTASNQERAAFLLSLDMETYDARAGFCMQAVVNIKHPQPQFLKRNWVRSACDDPAAVMQIVCREFVTVP